MRLTFRGERVLAVVAHPDDAELLCAGTLARAAEDGAIVGICVMCQGDKGQPAESIARLAAVRRKEVSAAADLLDASLYFGGWRDGTLCDGPKERLKLVRTFREFQPTLVLAHAPEDYHADHRAASVLAETASWMSASIGWETGESALEMPPALWWMDTITMIGFEPGFFIDISAHLELKEKMLACHRSQLARGQDGAFGPLQEVMRAQVKARGIQAEVKAAEAFRAYHTFKRGRAW